MPKAKRRPKGLDTVGPVAEYLRVSPKSLRQAALRGEGPPSYQLQGRIGYDWNDVLKWEDEQKKRVGVGFDGQEFFRAISDKDIDPIGRVIAERALEEAAKEPLRPKERNA